ncbi:MAG: P13 family porin [Spirochaetales bacterium]|nr:P13 family porin [Spirochaetales bacterium]
MKKILTATLLVLLLVPGTAFAVKLSPKDQNEIIGFKSAVAGMDTTQKIMYYNNQQKGLAVPLLLNFFLGCGIGSFAEGDNEGGLIGLAGELSSVSVYILGAANGNPDTALMGIIGLLAFRLYEIFRPISYTNEYNRQLSQALGVSSVQFAMTPTVAGDGSSGLSLAAKLTF